MAMLGFEEPLEAGSAASVRVDAIEVSQAVQNLAHDVPLLVGKRTVVRVYLSAVDRATTISGELRVHTDSTPLRFLPSLAPLTIAPGDPSLDDRRADITRSLNFVLPDELTTSGTVEVAVGRVDEQATGQACEFAGDLRRTVAFEVAPTLRVRLVGFRYLGASGQRHEPRAIDFSLLLSWLRRAYPVAGVTATQIVVNTGWGAGFDASVPNAQLAALRTQDLVDGADPRTHYVGLISDEGFFMRGMASGVPARADPSVVASAPTGPPTGLFRWDTDESYGDWYGGHELGHTLGRPHPGFCAQSHDDPDFPYEQGLISNGRQFVGLDMGDPDLAIPMRALPGDVWHDVMTYCEHQWVSPYTYAAMLARLREEESVDAGPQVVHGEPVDQPVADGSDGRTPVHVVARVDLARGEGSILFALPAPGLDRPDRFVADTRGADIRGVSMARSVQLRLVSSDGSVEFHDAPIRFDTDSDGETEARGLIDVVVRVPQDLESLELAWDGKVRTDFTIRGHAEAPKDIVVNFLEGPGAGDQAAGLQRGLVARKRMVEWAHPDDGGPRYTVKVSDDRGGTWQTIAVDQPTPTVELDPAQFQSTDLQLRVLATNGLHVDTRQFDVSLADEMRP
jgi:hypothetical protein